MRVGIIGAGFFGHHIAEQIALLFKGAEIELFEQENAPLLGSGTTNQCRLHMGFHYPRSGYTIYQSIMGFDRFVQQYGEFLEDIPNNLYAVHSKGLIAAEQYLAVMDSFSLPYERVSLPSNLFKHPQDIELLLRVPEKSIHVKKLRAKLSERFDGKLNLGVKIDKVDSAAGILHSGKQKFGPFDYVINASYTNPNLGLPVEKQFGIKWELAALVFAKTSLPASMAVTIMDGAFISIYPAYEGRHTLSSLLHTPFRRYTEYETLAADFPNRYVMAKQEGVLEKIGQDVQEHLNLDYEAEEVWLAAKTKLFTDKGDSRITEVRGHHRLLSVLCGKLDAVFEASDRILREIR